MNSQQNTKSSQSIGMIVNANHYVQNLYFLTFFNQKRFFLTSVFCASVANDKLALLTLVLSCKVL